MTNNSTFTPESTPPIGGFQEIDGRRLFVHSSGDGGPSVVFLPGASAIGFDYYLLQQAASKFTTAVIYDRGGSGYSTPMPLPRSGEEVATELRELLAARDVPGPYILVPHSLGGAYAQRFAQLYPDDVAGLVWIDAFYGNWDDYVPTHLGLAASEQIAPTREQLEQAVLVMRDMLAAMLADFPQDVRDSLVEYHVSETWISVGMAERTKLDKLADELKAAGSLPDVPVIALTAAGVDPSQQALMSEADLKAMHEGTVERDAAVTAEVSNGEQRILTHVNHTDIIFTGADDVVQAIRDVHDRATGAA